MLENSLLTDVNSLLQKFLTWKLVFEMHQNLVTTCSIIAATNCQCLRNINRMNRTVAHLLISCFELEYGLRVKSVALEYIS